MVFKSLSKDIRSEVDEFAIRITLDKQIPSRPDCRLAVFDTRAIAGRGLKLKIHDGAITLNAEPLNPEPLGKFPIERI